MSKNDRRALSSGPLQPNESPCCLPTEKYSALVFSTEAYTSSCNHAYVCVCVCVFCVPAALMQSIWSLPYLEFRFLFTTRTGRSGFNERVSMITDFFANASRDCRSSIAKQIANQTISNRNVNNSQMGFRF